MDRRSKMDRLNVEVTLAGETVATGEVTCLDSIRVMLDHEADRLGVAITDLRIALPREESDDASDDASDWWHDDERDDERDDGNECNRENENRQQARAERENFRTE